MATRRMTATIDGEAVARRAYARYVSRGYTHGHDQGDWYAAEAELRAEIEYDRKPRAAGKPTATRAAPKRAPAKKKP